MVAARSCSQASSTPTRISPSISRAASCRTRCPWTATCPTGTCRSTPASRRKRRRPPLSPRVTAWPLLIGFGTCSERLIRGAHALAERHGTGWGMMQFASHPSRKTADTLPLATLDAWGVLGPRTKLAHMVHVSDDDVALLARRDVKVAHCPSAALKHVKGLSAHGRFAEMLDAGVSVSLGGDSANGSNHFDMLRLMYLAALVPK